MGRGCRKEARGIKMLTRPNIPTLCNTATLQRVTFVTHVQAAGVARVRLPLVPIDTRQYATQRPSTFSGSQSRVRLLRRTHRRPTRGPTASATKQTNEIKKTAHPTQALPLPR